MKEVYSWAPWFTELSTKIAENDNSYLIENAKKVDWGRENPALLNYGQVNIDPFSFIYFLAQNNRRNSIPSIYASVHDVFRLNSEFPIPGLGDTFTFPTPPAHATALFHNGKSFFPDRLWNFFRKSITEPTNIRNDEFSCVLEIPMIGIRKITQCLFLVSPENFIPVDNTLPKSFKEVLRQLKMEDGWEKYLEYIENLRQTFPQSQLYEIARALFLFPHWYSNRRPKFYSVTTNALHERGILWDSDFSQNGTVHVNSFRNREKLIDVITGVEPGDVILARDGVVKACGLAVVEENGYANTYKDTEDALHVIWINRSNLKSKLSEKYQLENFGEDGPGLATGVYDSFRRIEAYKPTFDVIESFAESNGNGDKPKNGGRKMRSIPLNQILHGPPGTGKTYSTTKLCVEICDKQEFKDISEKIRRRFRELRDKDERIEFVTFHQSYGYEEFVEGLRPETLSGELALTGSDSILENSSAHQPAKAIGGFRLKTEAGVLKRIADRAREDSERSYVLIIDEINRANISKVLGELVTLLEEDKREGADNEVSVTLPYSKEAFTLPANLHILGTMNTADRSIALIDTALRRRFEFVEMPPEPERLEVVDGVNLPKVLETINERLEYLVDRDHLVGHAWFMGCENLDQIGNVMRNKIIPLLAEYFYDDWNKVRAVLGGGDHFVTRKTLSPPPGLEEDGGEDRYRWTVNKPPYSKEAYEDLIKPPSKLESSE